MKPRARLWSTTTVLVVLLVVWGIVARWMVLHSQYGFADSDEAITGLMAEHVLSGEFRTVYWGQAYGGTAESIVTAGLFALFGSSTLGLKLVPLVLSAATAIVVWRVGLRILRSPDAAGVAGAVYWAGPSVVLMESGRGDGFYATTIFLGGLTVLLVLGVAAPDATRSRWRWLALGFVVGEGIWASPQYAWVAIPVVVWLLVRRFRLVVTEGRWAVPGFVVGAAPWLAYNVANSWTGLQQTPTPVPGNSYLDHLKLFVSDGLPLAMGLRVPLIGNAVPSPALANFLYGAFVVLVAFAAWSLRGRASVLLLVVVAFPFLLAVSKQSFHLIDGRYIGPLVPILILLLVGGAYELHPRIGVPVLAIAVALFGYLGLGGLLGPSAPDSQQVVHALEGLHVDHAYADYWIAYSYTFASDEKIVITSLGPDRYKPYTEEVARSEHPAFIFFTGSELDLAFQHSLTVDGITATRVEPAPGLVVYLPAQKLVPFVGPGVLHFDLAPPS